MDISFTPASFPAGVLAEHVMIGGKCVDLIDTCCELVPELAGAKVRIVVDCRVSTNFSWYAAPWGRLMIDNAAETRLGFYKLRSEQAG